MPIVTDSLVNFLASKTQSHNGPDLLAHIHGGMEVQINVAAAGGEAVDGRRGYYSDGVRSWWNIRIPKHADSEPEFNDYELRWPLAEHAEAIGSTGWNWKARCSRYVGFDFDAITGHAAGVGISSEKLEQVKQAACGIPWVEVRKSTGGAGLHLYVRFQEPGIPTENHTIHAALGRAVLSMLSSEAGFDFASQVDACGGNMWIWHRKMTAANGGLSLVKASKKELAISDIPLNWRDHADVVTRRRAKTRVRGIENETDFESLATSRKFTPLDAKHKAIIAKLGALGYSTVWIGDYHLLQTHTHGLARLASEPELRAELGIAGFFQTLSAGSDPGEPNCFCFPLSDGGFKVGRYQPGAKEADTWEQDGIGWTTCYFNRVPDLATACKAMGAAEIDNRNGFEFKNANDALRAASALGETIELPERFRERKAILRANKDGRLVMDIARQEGESSPPGPWIEKKMPLRWSRVFQARTEGHAEESDDFDHLIRVTVTPAGEHAGIHLASSNGSWDLNTGSLAKMFLQSLNHSKGDAENIIGTSVRRRWEKVCLPFQPEYPGGRRWNLGAPQLRYRPADSRDGLQHPHWDKITNHIGQTLTPVLRDLQWAQDANMISGGDYMRAWYACILREPFEPLPYLFIHGPENSGKSIYWEAFDLLVTRGVAKADRVLTNQAEFNGELVGAIFCVIEEKNISATPGAMNKIKDYVTSPTIAIRRMRQDTYSLPNTTHWVHFSNSMHELPILPGDTRITMIYTPPLPPGAEIPKTGLLAKLREEAPAFLRTLLDMPLPTPTGRLRIPVVETSHKRQAIAERRTPLETFIAEVCFHTPGGKTAFAEFCERFTQWLSEEDRSKWTKHRIGREIPAEFPHGVQTGNVKYIGNLSLTHETPEDARRWIGLEGKLVRCDS